MTIYRDTSHLNTDIGGGVTIGSKSDRMCQGLGFSSAKIFNFAPLQSSDVDTDEVPWKFGQKINISRHADVWGCEAEELNTQDCCCW